MRIIKVNKLYSDGQCFIDKKISVENGFIISVEDLNSTETPDYDNVSAGLVDLHINGGEERHFTHQADIETLADIEQSALKNGVAYTLPTLITSSIENISKGIDAIKSYTLENPYTGILGMHLEGPFLSEKKRGAHLTKYLQIPNHEILNSIINIGNQTIKMITIAPELFTDEQLDLLIKSNIKVSFGHSNCDFKTAQSGFDNGVNMVTHLFNAMSALGHREPGLVGAALYNLKVYTPIILDNVHVAKEVAEMTYDLKGNRLFLISDALFQNHKKQKFQWEEFDAEIINGNYINADGNLAGATISMADAVKNAHNWLNVSIAQALQMATSIPAKLININRKIGKVEAGYEAKLCTFNDDLEEFRMI